MDASRQHCEHFEISVRTLPTYGRLWCIENANINTPLGYTHAARDLALDAGVWKGTGYYKTHTVCQSNSTSNSNALKFSTNVEWSNVVVSGTESMKASVGFQWNLKKSVQQNISYDVINPRLLLNCLDVEPVVNSTLINAAKDPRDGLIRIQTFSWTTFATQITAGLTGNYQWQIPVSVTSLKSLFFVMTDQSTKQNMNYLSTQFQHRGLLQYRVVIGGLPLNADWVNVYNTSGQNTFYESLYAL